MQDSAIQLILQAGYIVKGVLAILLLFSIISWAVIFYKWRYFSNAGRESSVFLKAFKRNRNSKELYSDAKNLNLSPLANLFKSVYAEESHGNKSETKRFLRRYEALEAAKLERYLNFLATAGSTTPFIGLFGTVWGIMNSFRGIGAAGSASLAIVAPGIAEALIATAMGLAVAIPAVIFYNYYLSRARRMIIEMEDFAEELFDFFTLQEGGGDQSVRQRQENKGV